MEESKIKVTVELKYTAEDGTVHTNVLKYQEVPDSSDVMQDVGDWLGDEVGIE